MTPIMATRMGASEMTTEFPAIYKEERELATRMTPVIPRMATNLVSGPICQLQWLTNTKNPTAVAKKYNNKNV